MLISSLKMMKPPIEPTKDDCCNSGCNPCIFDVYAKQLKHYEKCIEKGDSSCNITDHGISQLEYTTFYVVDVKQLSNNVKLFTFKKLKHGGIQKVYWKPGDHFLIKYVSPNKECTRAYTPIKMNLHDFGSKDYDFCIALKKYPNGLVSNYLFNLEIGQETLWRGPYGSYIIQPNKFNRIVMIAQGTGIAPFLSIAHSILSNEEDMSRIVLFYCCKEINDILFRNELFEFNSYWNFTYTIFLAINPNEYSSQTKYNEPILHKKFNKKELDNLKPSAKDQYLLCGSLKFMEEYNTILKNDNFSENIILF